MLINALVRFIVTKLEDMKGQGIIVLDVRHQSTFTDVMVICSGNSKRHIQSIAKHLVVEAKYQGLSTPNTEGIETGEWVLVDLIEVIVHIMQDESRRLYQLDKLWGML